MGLETRSAAGMARFGQILLSLLLVARNWRLPAAAGHIRLGPWHPSDIGCGILKPGGPAAMSIDYRERISQDPVVMVGKPVIKGTRIPVERIIGHLAENPDLDDLFGAYPELTIDDVKAALTSARAMIERGRGKRRVALGGNG